jgi:hypothetical protein
MTGRSDRALCGSRLTMSGWSRTRGSYWSLTSTASSGVHGYEKQGVAFVQTRRRGYHLLSASRADAAEALHVRVRASRPR